MVSKGSRKLPAVVTSSGNGSSGLRTDYNDIRADKPKPREKFAVGRLSGQQRFFRRHPNFAIAQH